MLFISIIIVIIIFIIIFIFKPNSTKPRAEILTLNKVNGCNDVSFGDPSVLEGDRIPPLKSHGQALEEELCFPEFSGAITSHYLVLFHSYARRRHCYAARATRWALPSISSCYYYYYLNSHVKYAINAKDYEKKKEKLVAAQEINRHATVCIGENIVRKTYNVISHHNQLNGAS